ncbi:FkbM family methyltransferase [Streptomyces scopuliridis]|uniref:FkbM family methyltransferase n=1 Tax=Streptomyces scopuliridis TaxID=452529 RepID=UPI0036D182F4
MPTGTPIPGVLAPVLDREGGLAPLGSPSELHFIGACLAGGYVGRKDLTQQRFVPDPFSTAPGERLYRAGDLVRRHPAGHLEILCRVDDQVKLRGHRIELGEIEAVALERPGITEAVATVRADAGPTPRAALPAPARGRSGESFEDSDRRDILLEYVDEVLEGRFHQEFVACRVETVSGVAAAEGIDRIDRLEIDVEGVELEVLLGIDGAFWPRVGNTVVEIDDRDGRRPAIEDIFHRHGFHRHGFHTEVTQQREYRDTGLRALFARRHR